MPVATFTDAKAKQPEGLKDGGHIYPACSNCNAFLMDIWRTRPYEKEVWKVAVNCPFCGDKSFSQEIQGGFHPGGYGKPKADDADDDIPITLYHSVEIVGDTFIFTVKKASDDVKAVYRHG